jgi:hypothetical protein
VRRSTDDQGCLDNTAYTERVQERNSIEIFRVQNLFINLDKSDELNNGAVVLNTKFKKTYITGK